MDISDCCREEVVVRKQAPERESYECSSCGHVCNLLLTKKLSKEEIWLEWYRRHGE